MESKKRILIVEDEQDARTLYLDILGAAGFMTVGAVDGLDALRQLSETKFDLILLDIIMPNKDGVETLEEISKNSEKYGKPEVYMLTNIGSDVAIEKAISLGASGYILKSDTSPEELVAQVRKVVS